MYKFLTVLASICFAFQLHGQDNLNMEILSNLPYQTNLSDIWGYVGPDGHEYAIVGTQVKTSVVDLADPSNPVEVAEFPGATSVWRDMKHFGEYVYVTTDQGSDGLLVIDMTNAPDSITGEFWQPDIEIDGTTTRLERCHNIYIDEDGYAYLAGCNMNSGGNIIIDVFSNPGQPEFVGATDPRYSHDAMVQNNLLYSSDINAGFFSVIDVSDKTDPMTLATQTTTSTFTHNAWVSDDNNYLFTTDERPNANVDAYDISDLTDIKRLDFFQPEASKGEGTIPHNTHYFEGYLVTSWYTDGVRIIDANKPDNLVEVAYYDTYPQNNAGFNGIWGVTPYLPSGIVIASDINTGLYVFDVNYTRAAYLEGLVSDADTGLPIESATVIIEGGQLNNKISNASGEYKTGQATAGQYTVTFSKLGYNSLTTTTDLVSGEVTSLDVELVPLNTYVIAGSVRSSIDNAPIPNASVFVSGEGFGYEVLADANGDFILDSVIEGNYQIYAGAWGYENILFNAAASLTQDENLDILLDEAYMDDFIVDMGWNTEAQASTGDWVREAPIGTFVNGGALSNPDADVEGDVGNKAYITGNAEGGVGDQDIDDGVVTLNSPIMDLSKFVNPQISYSLWFFNGGGNGAPNDMLTVRISNGEESVDIEVLGSGNSSSSWRPTFSFTVAELLDVTETMQFTVIASDDDPGHLVEAGLDQFFVDERPLSAEELIENELMTASPNPFEGTALLNFENEITGSIQVTNVLGQLVERLDLVNIKQLEIGSNYSAGTYFISLESEGKYYEALKIIKQ